MRISALFSEADLESIRKAAAAAERSTSGEIVPYVVERIDDHAEARWRAATIGALVAALAAGAAHALVGYWSGYGVAWITLPVLIGAGLGFLVGGAAPVTRWLMPADALDAMALRRAEAAFLEEEVWRTRDRTGILVFLALYEHRAVILADQGIHRAVPSGLWQELVDELVAGVAAGEAARALERTVRRCGEVLVEHRVTRQPDDRDELDDRPRIREH
jgi:putative membrane protein